MEKWREESETIASPYLDLKEKDKKCDSEIESFASKSGEPTRQRQEKEKKRRFF